MKNKTKYHTVCIVAISIPQHTYMTVYSKTQYSYLSDRFSNFTFDADDLTLFTLSYYWK